MRTRWLAAATIATAALVGALSAQTASATDPVSLDSGHVLDEAGVLSSAELDAAEARIEELAGASDLDLFVVYVDSFTNPSDAQSWTDAVATRNGLGPRDYLLAVAVEDRNYFFNADSSGPVSASQQQSIEAAIEDQLREDDWAGAVTAAADEMQGDGGAGLLRGLGIFAAVVAVALLIWLVIALIRRSRRNAAIRKRGAMPEKPDPNDPFSTMTDEQVETQAGLALVQADDAITSSKEELGFAVAQFGEQATATFSGALETAKTKMAEAFDLKQKLDDEIEDTIHDRRAWHIRIIQLAAEVDDVLDDNTEAFDALRKLEQNAPQELERVRGERAQLQTALAEAGPALATLSAAYDPAALATVADNPAQAQERAALADRAIAAAEKSIAAGSSGEAAFAIRTAEQSVAQAAQLIQSVSQLGAELGVIEKNAQALVAELQGDIAAAQQLPDPTGAIASAVTATATQLQSAQANLAAPSGRSPQAVLEALTAANTGIDAAIAAGRETVARAQRTQQMLAQTLAQAGSEIRAARDFIETRRGAVGSTARTRLSQAEATLNQAVGAQSADPESALGLARNALDLARQATSSAQADTSSYMPDAYQDDSWGGGLFGGGSRSNDSGLGGDILGGIIGGLLSGGGSSSRGSSWRSSGGGFRSSGFGGGGGGRSSRLSGGGGRSSRSGGGRF